MRKEFNLEEMYELYLKLCKLDKNNMPLNQQIETKRAFYGGAGMFHNAIMNELPKLSDHEASEELFSMENQIVKFWEKQQGLQFKFKSKN